MPTLKTIDPVTRIEGHLKLDIQVDAVNGVQQVVDARATGTLFRGFELLLANRPPLDAPYITQRVCGVCPVSHSMAAVNALESIANVATPPNARILRNLVLGSNFLQSHILHFYHLALQDFVDGPNMPPWQPSWRADKRLSGAATQNLVNNYVTALDMRRKAHEMGAIFGGRLPHPATFVPGGITAVPKAVDISRFRTYLNGLIAFITNVYIPDVEAIARAYADYFSLGRGSGNLIAYGVFDQDAAGATKLLRRGLARNGGAGVAGLNTSAITEKVMYSWYDDGTNNLNPANGQTQPVYPKGNAYSWMKSPRYDNAAFEAGPLARMWVNGDYRNGISVMDRHRARSQEALKVANAMTGWLGQVKVGASVYTQYPGTANGAGIGLTEAPRGALGHWVQVSNGVIGHYQIVTPTCWNCSPRDDANALGPLEHALLGTPIRNIDEPVEAMRVVHSYDPCLACAVHVMRPGKEGRLFEVEHALSI